MKTFCIDSVYSVIVLQGIEVVDIEGKCVVTTR